MLVGNEIHVVVKITMKEKSIPNRVTKQKEVLVIEKKGLQ